GGAAPAASPDAGGSPYAPGEVVARFRGGPPQRELELPPGIGVGEATRALEENPRIRWAAPNYIARAAAPVWIPNDRGTRSAPAGGWQRLQWHFLPCGSECSEDPGEALESFGGIDAPGAWENLAEVGAPGAKGIKVAVVDSGVAHRSKGKRFRRSPDLRRGQFARGRDFVEGDKAPLDENGHGTHVASTIGERTNNGKFVTGLAFRSKLIPVRVLDGLGEGKASDVARGIRWATRQGANVINLSLEFDRSVDGCEDVPSVCAAISRAHAKGTVVVSVAGNGFVSGVGSVSFPGHAPHAIAVGATTIRGCLADYSHFGEGLDLVAPGGGDDAALAGEQCDPAAKGPGIVQLTLTNVLSGRFTRFGYPNYEGSSMASAHVAGAAALVWAALRRTLGRDPTPGEVEARLEGTTRSDGGLADPRLYGAGLLDAAAATEP
ncbi:MAG: S8 family serine peptidase, partial [Solirubrobacterales bacterium]